MALVVNERGMIMNIHDEYKKAGVLHGHYCPGLAIGVRAAVEGRNILGEGSLSVIAERSACWLDGFSLIGATVANGKLKLHDTGKPVFSIYNTESGKSVRLVLKASPAGLSRDGMTQWLLTAPVDEVFTIGDIKQPFPEYKPAGREVLCAACGEPVLESKTIEKDGKYYCADCN